VVKQNFNLQDFSKMKRINTYLYTTLLVLTIGSLQAQNQSKADELYQSNAFNKAAELYENLLKKGVDSADIQRRLADAYYFNAQYTLALAHYQSYVDALSSVDEIYYLRLAKCLEASGQSEEAATYYTKFIGKETVDAKNDVATYSDYFNEVPVIELEPTLTSDLSEYPTAVFGESLYFISNRNIEKAADDWTGADLNTLYRKSLNEEYEEEIVFPKLTAYHEGSVALHPNGKTLYLTLGGKGNNFALDGVQIEVLKIHQFEKKGKRWMHVGALPFNSDSFNTAHPSLNSEGTMMYFSSDRPGGFGASDLYMVSINENGTFSDPKNLGPIVNTIGRESFPQTTPLDQLIFASDGHKGYGGFDLFGIDINASEPVLVNLGATYNSNQDDFSLVYCESSHGFLASNRALDSSDDIYVFTHQKPLDFTPVGQLKGSVAYKGSPLSLVELQLMNNTQNIANSKSREEGDFNFDLAVTSKLVLVLSKEGYESKEVVVTASPFEVVDLGVIELQKSLEHLQEGDDLADLFEIKMINFKFDQWDILPASYEDLAKIAEVLLKYPSMKIEIRSHTDQIGSYAYNQKLSEKRAQSTLNYLLNLGVNEAQLTSKGFGESQPLELCKGCSKEELMINRRSEFIVINK